MLTGWYRIVYPERTLITQHPMEDVEEGFLSISALTSEDFTSWDIIHILEGKAENANYHGMISMYERLYKILAQSGVHGALIKDIFIQIANQGGFIP